MNKRLFIIIVSIFLASNIYAQWEFNYFVIKFGANHNMFSQQPTSSNNLYLKTPTGISQLIPDKDFFSDYVPGATIGIDFHVDMPNDKLGFVIGANYQNKGISAKYISLNGNYSLVQTHRINCISIPFLIKIGNDIFNLQSYALIGARFDINWGLSITDKVSYNAIPKTVFITDKYFNQSNIGLVIGYNFYIFNFEFSYYLDNFLDRTYVENIGTKNDPQNVKFFEHQPQNVFFFQTSIYIPLSPWTKNRIYFLNRLFR